MIFHEYKTIFLHIGKTAGVAVEQLLRPGRRDTSVADLDSLFGVHKPSGAYMQHASAQWVEELLGRDILDEYYTFTVVRNPYTRLVSAYFYLIDQHREQYGSFENYILALPDLVEKLHVQKASHILPQTHYTHLDGEPVCDYIAYFEALPESLDPVRQLLGIKAELQSHNRIKRVERSKRPLAELYTDEMIQVMRNVYQQDFELLSYSTGLDNTRPLSGQVPVGSMRLFSSEKRQGIHEAQQIPRTLHQIWIGPDPIPPACRKWMTGWQELHPDWEYVLWTDQNLPTMRENSHVVFNASESYAAKADVLRYEIIEQFGGVYVDVDFECYKPIDEFVANMNFFGAWPVEGRIANGLFGACAHHPVLVNTVKQLVPRPPPDNGLIWLDRWLKEYLKTSNTPEKVNVVKKLSLFYPDYAVPWPTDNQGNKVSQIESRQHPFTKHHALKSWMKPEQRRNLKQFYAVDPAEQQQAQTMVLCLCARPSGLPGMQAQLTHYVNMIDSWGSLLDLADLHGITELLNHHLKTQEIEHPVDIQQRLQQHQMQAMDNKMANFVALKQANQVLSEAGISTGQ